MPLNSIYGVLGSVSKVLVATTKGPAMQIEELWTAGLSGCFAGDFQTVRALYHRDEIFAEMCRDFVEIFSLTQGDLEPAAHVRECLAGLRAEILMHFAHTCGGPQTGIGRPIRSGSAGKA